MPSVEIPERKITWEELEQHNTPKDAWIGLNGKVYDITNWMKHHPGGQEFLEIAAGKECSDLFQSFHKISTVSYLGTEKVPCVGELVTTKFPRFIGKSDFYKTLKKKAEEYFAKKNITNVRSITPFVFFNTIFILSGLLFSIYMSMYSTTTSPFMCFLFAVAGGVFHNLLMVHLLHDVSHGAYSNSATVWRYGSYIGDILSGHSMYVWTHRHVFTHHIHTNVCGVDPDIGIYKCSPKKPLLPYRQKVAIVPMWFQPFIYFFIVIQMQYDDFISWSRGYMENTKINDVGLRKSIEFYLFKGLFLLHRLVLPIMLGYRGFFSGLYLFLVTEAIGGLLFGYFSQITHVTEELEWPSDRPINEDWATLQVRTAIDYDPDSYFWTYMSGYLNYQIPHHLFPSVAPHHYGELLPLIKETCKEFNIKYLIYDSVWESIGRHFSHLKAFQHYRERYYQKVTSEGSQKSNLLVDQLDSLFRSIFGK